MLIVCPTCASEYTLEADRIGPNGRVVRCAACREPWFIAAPDPGDATQAAGRAVVASDVDPPSAREPVPRGERVRITRSGHPAARAGSARPARAVVARTVAACLVAVTASAIVFRAALVRGVPESAVVFAAIGLPVNVVGLTLGEVRSDMSRGANGRVLTVSGDITNATDRTVRVPRLTMIVEGERGEELYTWTEAAVEAELKPRDATRFEAHLASPPPDGTRVRVTFSTAATGREVASR